MGRALGKMKRTISVLLAAAMIVTALPQTSAPVYASEAQDVLDESRGSGETEIVGGGNENSDAGNGSVAADNEISYDESADSDENGAENNATDEAGSEDSDVLDENDSDGAVTDEADAEDVTDPAEAKEPEEDQLSSDIVEPVETDLPDNAHEVNVQAAENEETAETVKVRLNVPRYKSWSHDYSFLRQVWYATGDSEEFTRMYYQLDTNKYVDIPAKAGEKLRIKLVLRDRAVIDEVSYSGLEEDATATPIKPEEGDEHIYAIETVPSGNGEGPVYQINIKADYYYSLSFVDVYASKNPDAENKNKSVAFYQYAKDASGDDEVIGKDLIGEKLELSGQQMQEFFSEYNYALEVQERYTFYSIDANSSAMRFSQDKSSSYKNGYTLSGSYDLGAEDITVFVLAEPTKNNHLKFNIPAELKDKVQVNVIQSDPVHGSVGSGLEEDDAVWIDSDREVSFDVTIKDMNHTVRVTCEENGGDAVALPYNYRNELSDGWKNHFDLADADISMKNGDVTVNLEEINIYPVEFHLNPDEIDCIRMYAPIERTFRYYDYGESGSLTVWASEEEQLKFTVEPAKGGTLIVSTSEDGSGELYAGYSDDDYDDWNTYTVAPESSMSVYLTMVKGYQYQLDYDESDFDVKVCDASGNPLELSADHKFVSNTDNWYENFRIMVKMNSEKWTAASVTYEDRDNFSREAERRSGYDDEDNGYLCYLAEEVGCKTYGTNVITIEGYQTHTITFEGNEEAVTEGIWLRQYDKYDWDYEVDWEYRTDINLGGELEVRDGEEVYFTLRGINSATHRLNLSLSGSGDQVEVYEGEDFDREGTLYHFTAVSDATITAKLTERQQHTVTIEKGENVTDFQVSGSKTRPEGESGKTGSYLVRDGVFIAISGITGNESMAGYRGKVVCTIGEKSYEVPMKYGTEIDEEWISGACFEVEVTSDMTLTVDLVPIAQATITFTDMDKIASIKVWEAGKKPTEDNLYNSETKEAVLSDDKEYRLDFQLKDGYAAKSVVLKDKSSGEERVLERDKENEYRIYEIGVPQGDAQITIEAVQGYTVMFDIPAGADITFEEDITDYGNDITKDSIQVMATDSFRFRMTDGEDLYKLSVDSDAFTLEKILQQEYDYGTLVDAYYQYVLKPVAGAQLPEIVKIKAEEYAKHIITLDYPVEIKTIYLLDDNGEDYTISSKQAEVQGTGTVLGVKAISGYAAKVSVQGKTSGESKELTPFRLAEEDVSEYYLGELSEDVTITVTAERSQQKLVFYKVGFYSAGNGVRIRDAGTKALYSANEDYEEWGGFEYPYSILKGSSISFTVEPRDGYEVDGVYANGKAVTPVQSISSQQNVYTVVPMADTLITVNISKIAEKYPLTFTYPAAVSSVTVKGYELTDKKLEVKAGTKLEFTVELADTKHRITSVTMNGKEVAFNKSSGCYSITTVAEPMEIVITTAENIDKKVTFKNTVSHMLYSVVTNTQVTESGTDTYTVAALTGVLRFTVTSAKKESVPAVSYVNAADSKIVLQAKTKQDSESTIAYTYEISVSELAAESEIVIGETSTASAEDKAKLEECINKYKDKYNQEEYTPESWTAYTKALKAAEDCMKKDGATKAEVEAAIADLEKAVKGLTKKGEEPTPGTKEGLWFEILENDETADGSYVYTGAAIKPEIKVYFDDKPLEVKKDYTVAYKNNTNAGPATITVTGKGNFKGNATAGFEIKKKDIDAADISVADVYAIINNKGKVTNPKVTVKFGKKTLKINSDYAVTYPDIETVKDADGNEKIVAKDYTIRIITDAVKKDKEGKDVPSANYTGSREITYTVCANDIKLMSKATITLTAKSVDYADRNNPEIRPKVEKVKFGKTEADLDDFDFTYKDEDQAGKATITVTGKNKEKYYGSKSVTYDVKGTKLAAKELTIEGINAAYDYTGGPIYVSANGSDKGSLKVTRTKGVEVPVELKEGTDYEVSYKTGKKLGEHTGVGTVTVTITGINAYTGSVTKTFKITPVDLATFVGENIPAGREFGAPETAKYTKTGAKPGITKLTFNEADLVEKQDYTVTYQKNNKVETVAGNKSATMTIKGKGNFKGQIKHPYAVTIASADDVYATAVDIVKPAKLTQLKSTVKVFETDTGKALKAGTDYEKTIEYYSDAACETLIKEDNFETAAAVDQVIYAKVTMKGSYAGTTTTLVTAQFRVYDSTKKMTDKKVVVTVDTTHDKDDRPIAHDTSKAKNPYYTGKDIEPKVTVTIKGTGGAADTVLGEENYTVAYANNKNKGKATITVTGIGGGYGGSKSVKFTIVPKNMEWAEQAVRQAAEFLSNLMFAPN